MGMEAPFDGLLHYPGALSVHFTRILIFNTGAAAKSSIKDTGERNVTYPVERQWRTISLRRTL